MNPDVKLQTKEKMLSSWKGIVEAVSKEMITKEEFLQLATDVLKIVKDIKDTSSTEWKALKIAVDRIKEDIGGSADQSFNDIRSRIELVLKGQIDAIDEKLATIKDGKDGAKGADGLDGQDADEDQIVEDVLKRLPPPPILEPKTIRDRLEILKGDDRLSISAIKDLQDILDSLKKSISARGSGVILQRGAIKLYDLSSSLNGVLKTFSLPAFWRVISVQSSSMPNAFRPTTDYTTDAGASTITFTSEINAEGTLAEGQTLTVIYAES